MAQLNRSFSKASQKVTLALATVMAVSAAVGSAQACIGELSAPGQSSFYVMDKELNFRFKFDHEAEIGKPINQKRSQIAQRIPSVRKMGDIVIKSVRHMEEVCRKKLLEIALYTTATMGRFKITNCKVETSAAAIRKLGRETVERNIREAAEICDKWETVTLPPMKSRKINRGRTSSLSDEWNVMRPSSVVASLDMNNAAQVGANEAPVQLFRPQDDTKGPALELRIAA